MIRKLRIRVTTRIGLLFVLATGAGILAYAGPERRISWTITAAALAFTAVCLLIAWIGDERRRQGPITDEPASKPGR